MKEYETLTREKVDVVPFGCGMPETHLMQDWSDRMLDLILNGPTINGIKKDEVRAMLRETYTALKQYEKIGQMASPFINDPTAIVARAFSELYPGVEYVAQYVPDLRDETNGTAYGLTIFPNDGSTPIVWIKTPAGKAMPCDPAPVYYKAAPGGKDKIVTTRGEVVSCEIVPGAETTDAGYRPHWATCPQAGQFKRGGRARE